MYTYSPNLTEKLPDFSNTELAFKPKDNAHLRQSLWLFKMISSPFLVNIGPKMMELAFTLRLPIEGLVKKTLFQQFCGGENIEDTRKTSDLLYKFGVKTILDYSVEGEKNEKGFDETCAEIIATLVYGGKNEAVAFTACKLTGLGSFDLLAKVQANVQLTPAEVFAFERVKERLEKICQSALENQTPIFIDAEESWIQDTIDSLAEEMMEKYNREKPLIYTTVQLYRHDRLAYLKRLIQKQEGKSYFIGVKLVRGAYMEKEGMRAQEFGYENPIQPNKAATDNDYNAALELCIHHLDKVAICAGSHNEASNLLLAKLMQERQLPVNHPHVLFAQLLGMSDHISFNLGHHGYNVAKYLPYGPVKAVLPYLIRRANENTAVMGEAGRELKLLEIESKRRKK